MYWNFTQLSPIYLFFALIHCCIVWHFVNYYQYPLMINTLKLQMKYFYFDLFIRTQNLGPSLYLIFFLYFIIHAKFWKMTFLQRKSKWPSVWRLSDFLKKDIKKMQESMMIQCCEECHIVTFGRSLSFLSGWHHL